MLQHIPPWRSHLMMLWCLSQCSLSLWCCCFLTQNLMAQCLTATLQCAPLQHAVSQHCNPSTVSPCKVALHLSTVLLSPCTASPTACSFPPAMFLIVQNCTSPCDVLQYHQLPLPHLICKVSHTVNNTSKGVIFHSNI